MKRLTTGLLGVLTAVLVVGPALAQAQATFSIPFKFKAAGKNIPAGEYSLVVKGEGTLTLRQLSSGKELDITVYVLSEVWLSGKDGFLVHVTKGAHKNKTVTGSASKK
jgi:hypothetical protein